MKSNYKYKLGLFFIGLSIASPLLAFVVPFLGLSKVAAGTLTGLLLLGIPEVCTLVGIALIGKEGFIRIIGKLRKSIGLPETPRPAGRTQYNLALLLILLAVTTQLIVAYLPKIITVAWIEENSLLINLISDFTILISIFFIGGRQLVDKIKKLLTWESTY